MRKNILAVGLAAGALALLLLGLSTVQAAPPLQGEPVSIFTFDTEHVTKFVISEPKLKLSTTITHTIEPSHWYTTSLLSSTDTQQVTETLQALLDTRSVTTSATLADPVRVISITFANSDASESIQELRIGRSETTLPTLAVFTYISGTAQITRTYAIAPAQMQLIDKHLEGLAQRFIANRTQVVASQTAAATNAIATRAAEGSATAQAVATQTAVARTATQAAVVSQTVTAQTATAGTRTAISQTVIAGTQTAIAQTEADGTRTAVAQTATAGTQTAVAQVTATAQSVATQTAIAQQATAKEQADRQTTILIASVVGIIGLLILVLIIILIIRFLKSRGGAAAAETEKIPEPPPFTGPYLEALTVPGLEFNLERSGMTLGRGEDCDFKITDSVPGSKAISRYHARFEERNSRWVVIDGTTEGQRSTNGLFVNSKRTLENFLTDGVEIKFGEVPFRFHAQRVANNSAEGAQS